MGCGGDGRGGRGGGGWGERKSKGFTRVDDVTRTWQRLPIIDRRPQKTTSSPRPEDGG